MKSFLIYALRRIFLLIPFLIGLTILAFLLGVLAPGDPAMAVLIMDGTAEPTESELLAMRESMGLDQPFWMQYGSWLTHAAVGDLGVSYLTHRPVLSELMRRFPVTLHLALWAMGWVILLGIPAGIWAARRKGHAAEIGLELVALFFISGDALHMILPSFVLAAGTASAVLRLEQTSVLSVMEKPFLLTERAKGLSASYIEIYHVLPNSLMPVITMLGTFFASILGGSVIIENLFSIPGLGSYVLSAIWGRDYPVIQGYVLVSGTVFIVFNYLVDLSYYLLSPKAREG